MAKAATPSIDPFPIFMTSKEASRILSCSSSFLHQITKAKKGPPAYKMGRRLRWKKSDLIQWLEQNRI